MAHSWPCYFLLAAAIGLLCRPLNSPAAEELRAPLTSVAHVLSFKPEEGARRSPVRVRGTVTFCEPNQRLMYLEDSSGGIAVSLPPSTKSSPGVQKSGTTSSLAGELDYPQGSMVEVEGVTIRGPVHCSIQSYGVRVLGEGPLPVPLDLSSNDLLSEKAHGRRVRVKGWVPVVTRSGAQLNAELVVAPGVALDWVVLNGDTTPRDLAGSEVEAVGILRLKADSDGTKSGARLHTSGLDGVRKIRELPLTSIAEALKGAQDAGEPQPLRLRGTVVMHYLGEFLVVRENAASFRVPTQALTYYNPGTLVEVFGLPTRFQPELSLTNVFINPVKPDAPDEGTPVAISAPTAVNPNLTRLTQISQIRRLKPQEAARGYPVTVRGVVTYWDVSAYLHFVQDHSGGIYLDLSKIDPKPVLAPGRQVTVSGYSGPGDFAPLIMVREIGMEDETDLPVPEPAAFHDLRSGKYDSQWVKLMGVVRSQWQGSNETTLALYTGEGILKVTVPGPADPPPARNFTDAAVEVSGVCITQSDERRRLQNVELRVPDWRHLNVVESAPGDPFELSVKATGELFQFHLGNGSLHRTRLVGIVTFQDQDGSFYLQDAGGGVQVMPRGISDLPPGTAVDVVGFPVVLDRRAVLHDALVRRLRGAAPMQPAELEPHTPQNASRHGTLVRLEGRVLGYFSRVDQEVLTVQFGSEMVDALLQKRTRAERLRGISPGSVVRLTGVCRLRSSGLSKAEIMELLLRSAGDLEVLSRPPWWTLRHVMVALGSGSALLLLALVWASLLRRQVGQRTRELHDEIERQKQTEARLEAEIAERKRMEIRVEQTHQELLSASRQAGMAEVATSVLHNVGNVLNSLNVSASLITEQIHDSRIRGLARAAELLRRSPEELSQFLTTDPKGRQLPQYLAQLASYAEQERATLLAELDSLRKNIEHIKGIVATQQNFARGMGVVETVKTAELVEDALRINQEDLTRHQVQVCREFAPELPDIAIDKHKVLQVLVNLIGNARKACADSAQPEKRVTVRVANGDGRLKISVSDNGVGIKPEDLTRVFNHGFTTRKDGHGFGLHSGALTAKELGGGLVVQSEGPGKGATFTLELPAIREGVGLEGEAKR